MSADKISAEEMIDSLTGFDEIAIKKAFGAEWGQLVESSPVTFTRSLIFIQKRREGLLDAVAKDAALSLTLGEVNAVFAEDEPEVMPEDPETEAGKDDSQQLAPLTSSPPSAY